MRHLLPTSKLTYATALRTAQATALRGLLSSCTLPGRSLTGEELLARIRTATQIAESEVKDLEGMTRPSDQGLLDKEINAALTGVWTS